ncbi:hypothetical protein LguiB_036347 [Lonicera macranthoides]
MSTKLSPYLIFLISTIIFQFFSPAYSIGVNYGTVADNLPPPAQVAQFLKDKTTIDRVKLFDANPEIIRAFAGTGIAVTVTTPNGEIAGLANPANAQRWIDTNIKPFHPKTKINYIAVGNEVLHWGPPEAIDNLVAAMRSLNQALVQSGFTDIKVSTPHSLIILQPSQQPSLASFQPAWDVKVLAPMLQFCKETKSPFMVNPYPYFGYINLDMALFRPNPGYLDVATGKLYTNTFDMLMDSVYTSMKRLGPYGDVEIVVTETGWPSVGGPNNLQVSVENAAAYNGGLLRKVSSGEGTPLMPGRRFETYIFGLFNENLKPNLIEEKNFGLFRPDFTPVYDIGIMRGGAKPQPQPQPQPQPRRTRTRTQPQPQPQPQQQPGKGGKKWCIAKPDATDAVLQNNIEWLCSTQGIDCKPTQYGGPCFEPNTKMAHASYLMNSYYQTNGRNDFNCDFQNTGLITNVDPSKGGCVYMS